MRLDQPTSLCVVPLERLSSVSLLITAQDLERTVNLSGAAFIAALLPSHHAVIIVAGAGL